MCWDDAAKKIQKGTNAQQLPLAEEEIPAAARLLERQSLEGSVRDDF